MDGAERHLREEVVAECFEIRAVAEAPWRNPGQLTVGPQQPRRKCQERRVEIIDLDSGGAQSFARGGLAIQFSIRRVENDAIVIGRQ